MANAETKITVAKTIHRANPERDPVFSAKQMKNIKTVTGIVLAVSAVAGGVALAAAAPNIFVALDKLYKTAKKLNKKQKERIVSQTLHYLKRSGQISLKTNADDIKITLTSLGRKQIKKLAFDTLTVDRSKKWNAKWWQAAADIPTKSHKLAADALRYKLKTMGFFPLQRTLWFYPYDPRAELQQIIDHYDVSRFVTTMEINRLDKSDEQLLKTHFKKINVL